jgi:hypothetical protein
MIPKLPSTKTFKWFTRDRPKHSGHRVVNHYHGYKGQVIPVSLKTLVIYAFTIVENSLSITI